MSKRLDPAEFSNARDRVMKAFPPAGFRQVQAWFTDWKSAAQRMHYLNIHHAEMSDSLRMLIQIRGTLQRPNLGFDLIKPDIENLWKETASQAEEAAHAFYNLPDGFDFAFFAVSQSTYITGTFSVQRKK